MDVTDLPQPLASTLLRQLLPRVESRRLPEVNKRMPMGFRATCDARP